MREKYAENMKDKKWVQNRREVKRLYEWERRRKAGVPERGFRKRTYTREWQRDTLPIDPFKAWAQEKIEEYGSIKKFATSVEVDARNIHRVIYEHEVISVGLVDRYLIREGSTDLWELYPSLYE